MQSTIEVLREARALLAKPNGWTQRTNARDEKGEEIGVLRPGAVCFCASGAVHRMAYLVSGREFELGRTSQYAILTNAAQHRLCQSLPLKSGGTRPELTKWNDPDLTRWNDDSERTQEEVIAVFDRAIAAELAKEVESGEAVSP